MKEPSSQAGRALQGGHLIYIRYEYGSAGKGREGKAGANIGTLEIMTVRCKDMYQDCDNVDRKYYVFESFLKTSS